jgi:hypothetical protein
MLLGAPAAGVPPPVCLCVRGDSPRVACFAWRCCCRLPRVRSWAVHPVGAFRRLLVRPGPLPSTHSFAGRLPVLWLFCRQHQPWSARLNPPRLPLSPPAAAAVATLARGLGVFCIALGGRAPLPLHSVSYPCLRFLIHVVPVSPSNHCRRPGSPFAHTSSWHALLLLCCALTAPSDYPAAGAR